MKKMFSMFGAQRKHADALPEDSIAPRSEDQKSSDLYHDAKLDLLGELGEDTGPHSGGNPASEADGDVLESLADDIGEIVAARNDPDIGDDDSSDEQVRAVVELGERHEVIIARLGQVNEILQPLLDAHKLVERLVVPLSATFRHHQSMTGQNIALQNAVDHLNTEMVTLREREATASTRATALNLKLHHLYDSYTEVQDLYSVAQDDLRTVSGALRNRDEAISDIERRVHELTVEIDELKDDLEEANLRREDAITAQRALSQQLRQERENHQALDQEHESLQTSVQHTVAEVAQLSRRLNDAEEVATNSREQALHIEALLANTQAEKVRLLEQVSELEQSIAEERRNLAVKAEGMRGRSVTLERILGQTREDMNAQSEELRNALQKNTEMAISINRLETRCEKLLSDLQRREEEHRFTEDARAALGEQVEATTKATQAKDTALHRAKEVLEAQAQQLGKLEGQASAQAESYERRITALTAALEQERAKRALVDGTLEATRHENSRLQRELINYRSSYIDESPVEAQPTAEPLSLTSASFEMPVSMVPPNSGENASDQIAAQSEADSTWAVKLRPQAPIIRVVDSRTKELDTLEQ